MRFYIQNGVEVATSLASDFRAALNERDRLRAALEQGRMLVGEMDARMPEQATEDEDGFIASYRIPVGPWHRILGWARGGW